MQKDQDTSGEFEPIRFHDVASSFPHSCPASIALHLLNIHWNVPRNHYHGNKKQDQNNHNRTGHKNNQTPARKCSAVLRCIVSHDFHQNLLQRPLWKFCCYVCSWPARTGCETWNNMTMFGSSSLSLNPLHDFSSCTVPISGSIRAADSHVGTVTRLRRELVLLLFSFRFSWNSCNSCAVLSCTGGFIWSLTGVVVGGLEPLVAAKLSLDFRTLSTSSSKSSNALCQSRCLKSEGRNKLKDDNYTNYINYIYICVNIVTSDSFGFSVRDLTCHLWNSVVYCPLAVVALVCVRNWKQRLASTKNVTSTGKKQAHNNLS